MEYLLFIIAVIVIIAMIVLFRYLNFRKVVQIFEDESVCVYGPRGSGKDMLMSNVCAYRNKRYISNTPLTSNKELYIPLSRRYLELGGNKFKNFAEGKIVKYEYPLDDNIDFYISDCGVYYPSQYCNILNNIYDEVPLFQALARHLGDCNVHWNCQNLNRVWDKFREQGERYIRCLDTKVRKVFGKLYVTQKVVIYDKYQSALDRVDPLVLKKPFLGKSIKYDVEIEKQRFKCQYGSVVKMTLGYVMKSNYNTRFFKELLKNGKEKKE